MGLEGLGRPVPVELKTRHHPLDEAARKAAEAAMAIPGDESLVSGAGSGEGKGSTVETEDETTKRLKDIDGSVSTRFVFGKFRGRVVLHGKEVQGAEVNLDGMHDYHTFPDDINEAKFDRTGQIFTANELFKTVIPHPEAYPEFQELVKSPTLAYYADPRRHETAKVSLIYPVDGNDGHGPNGIGRPYLIMFVGLEMPTEQLKGLIEIVKEDPNRVEEFYQIATDGLGESVQRRKAPRIALMDLARFIPLDKFPGARGIDALAERVISYGETDKLDINGITWLDYPDRSSQQEPVPQRAGFEEVRELNSNGEVWPKEEPVVRFRRGFRRRDLAEQHVAVMWGGAQYDGTNIDDFSSPFPVTEPDGSPYPGRERLSGFREAVVTVMDDIIDARVDFNSEIGQIIIKHVSALAPEGRQAFWWCLSSRIGYVLGRDKPIEAPAGLPITRGTFSNPDGLHAQDWGWLVQTGRFIQSHADMTGGLHRPDGQPVSLTSNAEARPMIEDVVVPIEEIRADYINGRDRARERVNTNLEIFRRLTEGGERIGNSFITDYQSNGDIDRGLQGRVSTAVLPSDQWLSASERILSFRELAGQFVRGQFTPDMLRDRNLGNVFTNDVLVTVQDEVFRIVWDNHRRLQHGGDPYPFYPGNTNTMGRMVGLTGEVLPEYREWMEQIVTSPQYEAWLGTNPPDLRHSNNYPNRDPYLGWLSAQRRKFSPETNLFAPDQSVQNRARVLEVDKRVEKQSLSDAAQVITKTERGVLRPQERPEDAVSYYKAVLTIGASVDDMTGRIAQNPECVMAVAGDFTKQLQAAVVRAEQTDDYLEAENLARNARNFGIDKVLPQLQQMTDAVLEEAGSVGAVPERQLDEAGRELTRDLRAITEWSQEGIMTPDQNPLSAINYYKAVLRLGSIIGNATLQISQNENSSRAAAREVFMQLNTSIKSAMGTDDYSEVDRVARIARGFEIDRVLPQLRQATDAVLASDNEE